MGRILVTRTTFKRTEESIPCERFVRVPGWVWPFACDYCAVDIEEEDTEVVVNLGNADIRHYHAGCWESVYQAD